MAFDTLRKDYTKEHLWYVEIEVDGTTYRFCENRAPMPVGLDATPSLTSVRTSPAEIDLEGGIGIRAKCTITLDESMDEEAFGSIGNPVRFWSRWRAENPFYLGGRVSVFSGYISNNQFRAANFTRRDYIFESFAQSAGGVSITGKDPLKLADNDRAKAPRESKGVLVGDVSEVQSSLNLSPSGIGSEYPSSGIVRIGDEVISYGSKSGDSLLSLTRGDFNTQAQSHEAEDAVQLCLYFNSETPADIGYELLTNYASVDPAFINRPAWDAESSAAFANTYTALITEPTGVRDLLKEFAQSAPHYLYYDERVNQIRWIALQPPPVDAPRYNYQQNIIEGSSIVKDMQDMRISRVLVAYGIIDPTKDLDEPSNYRDRYVRVDNTQEANYGQVKYKRIYSRWITSDNKTAAVLMASRVGRRFAQAPRMLSMQLDAKDADVWVGDSVQVQTDLIEQSGGGLPFLPYQILSASEGQNYRYEMLEHTYGDPVDGDEDVEDPNVRLVFISGQQDRLAIPGDTAQRTLRELYEVVYGTGPIDPDFDVRFVFEANAVAGSSEQSSYAVLTGSWPELNTPIMIINNGVIVGRGGDGMSAGGAPTNGGPAIQLQDNIRLNNASIIGGGGGGGEARQNGPATAAGGGGAGYFNGIGGTGTSYSPSANATRLEPAQPGTNTQGGDGGVAEGKTSGEFFIVFGGNGGDLGQDTTLATAGKAIDLNGFTVTYIETGTIIGDVS